MALYMGKYKISGSGSGETYKPMIGGTGNIRTGTGSLEEETLSCNSLVTMYFSGEGSGADTATMVVNNANIASIYRVNDTNSLSCISMSGPISIAIKKDSHISILNTGSTCLWSICDI